MWLEGTEPSENRKVGWSRLWGPESQPNTLFYHFPPSIPSFTLQIISLSQSNIYVNIVPTTIILVPQELSLTFFTSFLPIYILMLIIKYLSLPFHSHGHHYFLFPRISFLFCSFLILHSSIPRTLPLIYFVIQSSFIQ